MPGFVRRDPVAHFEGHHLLLAVHVELVARAERIRRLLVVVEHELAADGADLGRVRHAEAPSGDVDFVDALVAEIAVAGVPEPVPVVMEAVLGEVALRRRPGPEVVVDARRAPPRPARGRWCRATCSRGRAPCRPRRARRRASAGRLRAAPVTSGSGCPAGRCGRTCARRRRSAALRRCCASTASRRRRPCRPGTPRWSGACASGSAWRSRLRRSILSSSSLRVDVGGRLVLAFLVEHLELRRDVRLVDVTERDDLDVGHRGPRADVAGPAAAAADDRYPDRVVRARKAADSRTSGQHCRAHQEVSSVHSRPSNHAVWVRQRTPPASLARSGDTPRPGRF